MQDHIMVPVAMEIKEKWSLNEKTADTLWNLLQYMFLKKGVFSSQHLESMAFLKTRPELNYPDLQLHFSNGLLSEGVAQIFGIPLLKAAEWGVTILPTLLHPKSLGSVQLRSSNPLDAPTIKPNYLADPEDRRVLIEGVKIARKILNSEAFKSIQGPMINDDTIPYPLDSDEYILEYIKRYVFTVFHPVGTCRMGPEGDPNSVRVIDASIMPEVISGNTNAPAIMIGEKGADLIKESWKNTPSARM
jgi:choline dehydrogenase